jgi:hypothetical protein
MEINQKHNNAKRIAFLWLTGQSMSIKNGDRIAVRDSDHVSRQHLGMSDAKGQQQQP